MKCQKVTFVKSWLLGHYKKDCHKESVIQDANGRWLCQHHYNKWIAKINKLHIGREDMKLQYRVEYEFEIDGKKYSGVETEASWFYIDQRGAFYDSAPMRPISPVGEKIYKTNPSYKKLVMNICQLMRLKNG